jgi:hypothetical protein
MDISVSTSGESGERTPEPEPTPEPNAEAAPSRPQPHYPRGTGSSLPTGMDPAVMYKWLKIGGFVVGILVVILIIKSVFTGRSNAQRTTDTTAAATAVASAPTITLVAVNPVNVKVQRKNPDGSYGDVVFDGMLARGESRTVSWPGELYVTASAGENLLFEVNGRRSAMGQTGPAVGQLPAPKR